MIRRNDGLDGGSWLPNICRLRIEEMQLEMELFSDGFHMHSIRFGVHTNINAPKFGGLL